MYLLYTNNYKNEYKKIIKIHTLTRILPKMLENRILLRGEI